jgi:hypothetical protein
MADKAFAHNEELKLVEYIKDKLGTEQNGFRRGCLCSDIFFLSLKKNHRELSVETLVNLEKTFDTVCCLQMISDYSHQN